MRKQLTCIVRLSEAVNLILNPETRVITTVEKFVCKVGCLDTKNQVILTPRFKFPL